MYSYTIPDYIPACTFASIKILQTLILGAGGARLTEFIIRRALPAPLLNSGATAQSLQVINFIDPCVMKFNYYKNVM